jgi:hypothetical protein
VPPTDEDATTEDESDSVDDASGEVLTDATEFPDDLSDTGTSSPGLVTLFDQATLSAVGLQDVRTEVVVTKYPDGSTPIRIRREIDGTVTVLSHNADLVYEDMVRVALKITYKSTADGRPRSISGQTIISKSSQ